MPATIERPTASERPKTAKTPAVATDLKWCVAHKGEDKRVERSRFDHNPLTSDGLHVSCRSCTTPAEIDRRTAHATAQLRRQGLHPGIPITMKVDAIK